MRRSSIYTLAVLVLGATAFAQQDLRSRLRLKSQVKWAGIYHYGLGTWTRPGAINNESELGPVFSTIYNNTCSSPYFGAWYPGEYWTDEGRLPSQTSPDKIFSESQAGVGAGFVGSVNECPEGPSSAVGSADGSANGYTINGFQIGYCSMSIGATTSIILEIRDTTVIDAVRCAEKRATAPAPVASFSLTSFPGNAGGPFGCWAVSIDLSAVSFSFSMRADGTGSYTNPARSADLQHMFSWAFTFPSNPIPTASAASGFFLQGNQANQTQGPNQPISGTPNSNGWKVFVTTGGSGDACSGYDGTVWDKHGANATPSMFNGGNNGSRGTFGFVAAPFGIGGNEDGTGMSTQDCVRIDNPSLNPMGAANGSYWFGGPASPATNPFSSFHLELYTLDNTVFVSAPGTGFCYGDGCAFTCPCTVGTIPDPQGHHESGCSNAPSFGTNIGSILTSSGSSNPFVGETVKLTCQIDFVSPFQVPLALCVKGNARLENGAFPANNDGARCVDGGLVRFGSHFVGANGNPPGFWEYPTTFGSETIPISIRGASSNGQVSWYQVFHRNTPNSFCFSDSLAGTNWSNGMIVKWGAP
jgi:hypothetical protein